MNSINSSTFPVGTVNFDKTINKEKKEIENKQPDTKNIINTEPAIKDEQTLHKISSSKFDNSFNFNVRTKNEGGDGGLATTNPNALATKFYPAVNPTTNNKGLDEKVNLDSIEDRVKFSNSTTQLGSVASVNNDFGCGASCIVNGSMIKGGKEGLNNLIKVIKERKNESFENVGVTVKKYKEIPGFEKLGDIENKIKNNNVSRQDLLDLQNIVYCQLRHMEKGANAKTPAIGLKEMQDYVNTDTSTFGIIKEKPLGSTFSDINIKLLDTNADKTDTEHYVLCFNPAGSGPETEIFDPWPRKSGNQIVKDSAELDVYHQSVMGSVR